MYVTHLISFHVLYNNIVGVLDAMGVLKRQTNIQKFEKKKSRTQLKVWRNCEIIIDMHFEYYVYNTTQLFNKLFFYTLL